MMFVIRFQCGRKYKNMFMCKCSRKGFQYRYLGEFDCTVFQESFLYCIGNQFISLDSTINIKIKSTSLDKSYTTILLDNNNKTKRVTPLFTLFSTKIHPIFRVFFSFLQFSGLFYFRTWFLRWYSVSTNNFAS